MKPHEVREGIITCLTNRMEVTEVIIPPGYGLIVIPTNHAAFKLDLGPGDYDVEGATMPLGDDAFPVAFVVVELDALPVMLANIGMVAPTIFASLKATMAKRAKGSVTLH